MEKPIEINLKSVACLRSRDVLLGMIWGHLKLNYALLMYNYALDNVTFVLQDTFNEEKD